jgi:hypothetical protein
MFVDDGVSTTKKHAVSCRKEDTPHAWIANIDDELATA